VTIISMVIILTGILIANWSGRAAKSSGL
jgi:hypothetical protein